MKANHVCAPCIVAIVLAGCVSPSQMLVGPQGNVMRCSASGFGFIGAPLAEHSVTTCVNDFKNAGYLPSDEVGTIGLQFSDGAQSTATVSVVQPNSPAALVGLLVGDQITKVNGQQVLDRAAARTMMFGKAGGSVSLTIKRNDTELEFKIVRARRADIPS